MLTKPLPPVDYLRTRLARAWDALYQQVELNWEVDRMDKLLAGAQSPTQPADPTASGA